MGHQLRVFGDNRFGQDGIAGGAPLRVFRHDPAYLLRQVLGLHVAGGTG